MTSTVRYDVRHDSWFFGEEERSHDGTGSIVVMRNDLADTTATDLAREMRRARRTEMDPAEVLIYAGLDEGMPKYGPFESVSFGLLPDDRFALHCHLDPGDSEPPSYPMVAELCAPLLQRLGASLAGASMCGESPDDTHIYKVVVAVPTRKRTLEGLYHFGWGVKTLVDTATKGQLTRATVADLIAGGHAGLLIGQPEGPWLDVKTQHYDLASPKGKISLAQAVSRFANAEDGGIVVVGMGTKKIPGGELIHSVKPVPVDTATVRRYRQAIETCLFPFPAGLEIQLVELTPGEGLVLVSLPPQEEELKPFLVHGAIVGDRVEGAYISIVRRSGEDSIPITAQQIHSTLSAGRALMRRGYVHPADGK